MNISDITNKIYLLTKTNATSFPTASMLICINNAYERVASLIFSADGRWQFDDSNQTDLPIATTTITTGQQDYSLATTHLNIQRVEVKDTNGNWQKLLPIDKADVYDQSITDFMKGGGTPLYYDKFGTTIMLYPSPSYTQAASLKLYFDRGPVLFTSAEVSTGTKTPGFNNLYHDLIPLWASYDYALANGLKNANQLMVEIQRKEEALKEDFALRSADEHLKLSPRKLRYQYR